MTEGAGGGREMELVNAREDEDRGGYFRYFQAARRTYLGAAGAGGGGAPAAVVAV